MIPTMILVGAVLGRWWKTALIVAAVVWPLVLVVGGVVPVGSLLLGAAALGVANAALGVAGHRIVLHLMRKPRWSRP